MFGSQILMINSIFLMEYNGQTERVITRVDEALWNRFLLRVRLKRSDFSCFPHSSSLQIKPNKGERDTAKGINNVYMLVMENALCCKLRISNPFFSVTHVRMCFWWMKMVDIEGERRWTSLGSLTFVFSFPHSAHLLTSLWAMRFAI